MEEEKAAAYYDELTRRGEGAARFKQGLGFSSNDDRKDNIPERGSALPSSSSFLSTFVRASSPNSTSKLEKQSQLESIQNKLKKKPEKEPRVPERSSHRDRSRSRDRDRDGDRDRDRHSRRRSRSRSRSRERYRERRRRSRSRSRSTRRERRTRSRSRSRSPRRERRSEKRRTRSRSRSPRERRRSEREGKATKERNGEVDYSRLIEGYDRMSAAERVKAKMKLLLAETAEKDPTRGMGSGWERFEFNKDAPLDDEEVEAAGDDAAILKHIGQSFRFSAIETRREEQVKAAHDEAIFGSSTVPVSVTVNSESEEEDEKKDSNNNGLATSLLSEKVLAKQPGSWRDRVRKA